MFCLRLDIHVVSAVCSVCIACWKSWCSPGPLGAAAPLLSEQREADGGLKCTDGAAQSRSCCCAAVHGAGSNPDLISKGKMFLGFGAGLSWCCFVKARAVFWWWCNVGKRHHNERARRCQPSCQDALWCSCRAGAGGTTQTLGTWGDTGPLVVSVQNKTRCWCGLSLWDGSSLQPCSLSWCQHVPANGLALML